MVTKVKTQEPRTAWKRLAVSAACTLALAATFSVMGAQKTWAATGSVHIDYLGHSQVMLTSSQNTKVLIDPPTLDAKGDVVLGPQMHGNYPLHPPTVTPNAVAVTSEDFDLNNVHASWIQGTPQIFNEIAYHGYTQGEDDLYTPVNTTINDITMNSVRTTFYPQDEPNFPGTGSNASLVFQMDGMRIVDLGDSFGSLKHGFTSDEISQLGQPDVLFVPISQNSAPYVGETPGESNISINEVVDAINALHPKVVIPMHYWTQGDLSVFLQQLKTADSAVSIAYQPGSTNLSADSLPTSTQLLVMDYMPPEVTGTDPMNGGTSGVSVNKTLTLTYGEAVHAGGNLTGITLTDDAGNTVPISSQVTDQRLIVKPQGDLTYNTHYTLNVPADAVLDQSGNTMASAYQMTFYTGTPATFQPTVGSIASGEFHSLAIKGDGSVWQWGTAPERIQGISNVTAVASGGTFDMLLLQDGTVDTSGNNSNNQLGRNPTPSLYSEVFGPNGYPNLLTNVAQVAAGYDFAVVRKNDGTVWTWGNNEEGQLGIGSGPNQADPSSYSSALPVQVMTKDSQGNLIPLTNVAQVAAGNSYGLAITADGTVYSWGDNSGGQLGNGTGYDPLGNNASFQPYAAPVQTKDSNGNLVPLTGVTMVAGGSQYSLALKADGTVWSWGTNSNGQLGDNTTVDKQWAVQVQINDGHGNLSPLQGVKQVAANQTYNTSVALRQDGTVLTWGGIAYGDSTDLLTPTTELYDVGGGLMLPFDQVDFITGNSAMRHDGSVWHFDPESAPTPYIGLYLTTGQGVIRPHVISTTQNSVTFSDLMDSNTVNLGITGDGYSGTTKTTVQNTTFTYYETDPHGFNGQSMWGVTETFNVSEAADNYGNTTGGSYANTWTNPHATENFAPIPNQFAIAGESPTILDLTKYFKDDDGDVTTYSVYSQDIVNNTVQPSSIESYVRGDKLYLQPKSQGTAEVHVTPSKANSYEGYGGGEVPISTDFNMTVIPLQQTLTLPYGQTLEQGAQFNNITLTDANKNNISVTPSISGENLILTINGTMTKGVRYTMDIPEGALQIWDNTQNQFFNNWDTSFSFTGKDDMVAPTLQSSQPANNATDVSITDPLTVTFSEPVQAGANFGGYSDPITLVDANDPNHNQIPIKTSLSGETLTIAPGESTYMYTKLKPNTTYKLHIPADAVRDLAGNPFAAPQDITFTTVTDTTPPTVTSTSPANGDQSVPFNKNEMTVNLSEDVQIGDNFNNISMQDNQGNPVSINPSFDNMTNTGNHFGIYLNSPLKPGTTYTVTIPAGAVKDMAGNPLANDVQYTFTTQVNLQVVSSTPADNSTDNDLLTSFTVTFNHEIKAGDLTPIQLYAADTHAPLSVQSSVNGNQLTVQLLPSQPEMYNKLVAGRSYELMIPNTAILGTDGSTMEDSYTLHFSTKADSTPPSIVSTTPAAGATGVNPSDPILLTFNKDVMSGMNFYNIALYDDQNNPNYVNANWIDSTHLQLQTFGLQSGTHYTLQIPDQAINDMAGNQLPASSLSFTTGQDTNPPAVSFTTPQNGDTGVDTMQPIVVTFDKSVTAGTSYNKISYTDGAGHQVAFQAQLQDPTSAEPTTSGNTLMLMVQQPLNPNTKYTVHIPADAVVASANGKPLGSDLTISFTTTDQPVNGQGTVTFSVVDSNQQPLPGATLLFFNQGADETRQNIVTQASYYDGANAAPTLVDPGTYDIVVVQPGYQDVKLSGQAVTSGGTLDLGQIMMSQKANFPTEIGTVLANGQTVAGLEAKLDMNYGTGNLTITKANDGAMADLSQYGANTVFTIQANTGDETPDIVSGIGNIQDWSFDSNTRILTIHVKGTSFFDQMSQSSLGSVVGLHINFYHPLLSVPHLTGAHFSSNGYGIGYPWVDTDTQNMTVAVLGDKSTTNPFFQAFLPPQLLATWNLKSLDDLGVQFNDGTDQTVTGVISGSLDKGVLVNVKINFNLDTTQNNITFGNKQNVKSMQLTQNNPKPSAALTAGQVTITNNTGENDQISVTGLTAGDVIKVYNPTSNQLLATSAPVADGSHTATITLALPNATGGSVKLTLTSVGMLEGPALTATYGAESSSPIDPSSIVVTNNSGTTTDSVTVNNLLKGDKINVYTDANQTKPAATGTVASGKTSVTIPLKTLNASGGSLYITLVRGTQPESARTTKQYTAEPSLAPTAKNIVVINNRDDQQLGNQDEVKVNGLLSGDTVSVYAKSDDTKPINTATATPGAKNTFSATVMLTLPTDSAGSVYVSVTSTNLLESSRTLANYITQPPTGPASGSIQIINNIGATNDTVNVSNLQSGDTVNVYASPTDSKALTTAKADKNGHAVAKVKLPNSAGSLYVSVTSSNKAIPESTRTEVKYTQEQSATIDPKNVVVINNREGTDDSMTVSSLAAGDVITVYDGNGKQLAQTTAAATDASNKKFAATLTLTLPTNEAGSVFVTRTSTGYLESAQTAVKYMMQAPLGPDLKNITVVNAIGTTKDTLTVSGLNKGDKINVYASATDAKPLTTATADASGNAIAKLKLTIGGTLYVSVTSVDKTVPESMRTAVAYQAEHSVKLDPKTITLKTNAQGTYDLTVTGLAAGDQITVYDQNGQPLAPVTASGANKKYSATVTLSQLTGSSGAITVTRTASGYLESDPTTVNFLMFPSTAQITVNDNDGTKNDSITVAGLNAGDKVFIYQNPGDTKPKWQGTADKNGFVKIPVQLTGSGTLYVSVKGSKTIETLTTLVTYGVNTLITGQSSSALVSGLQLFTETSTEPNPLWFELD